MVKMLEVTHVCCSHLVNCQRLWKTQEPEYLAREAVVFEMCNECIKTEKEMNNELIGGGEL